MRGYSLLEALVAISVLAVGVAALAHLTVLATPEVQKQLAGQMTVTIAGQLEYQACDDKVCYAPTTVPLNFTLDLTPLLRP